MEATQALGAEETAVSARPSGLRGFLADAGGALFEAVVSTTSEAGECALMGVPEAAGFAADVEELSRQIEYLQVVAASAVEKSRRLATGPASEPLEASVLSGLVPPGASEPADSGASNSATPNFVASNSIGASVADDGFRNAAEFLRSALRISIGEARRRLCLAESLLPRTSFTGQPQPPVRPELAAAFAGGTVGSRSATIITMALERVRHHATPEASERMEHSVTRTAQEADPDFVSRICRRWTDAIDQDGSEPSEAELRHRQGAFLRAARRGLHHVEIFATTAQYECLLTVMNAATNPRLAGDAAGFGGVGDDAAGVKEATVGSGSGVGGEAVTIQAESQLDQRTRPQRLLDGLVSACSAALSTTALPAAGGLRPQVMVTIDFRDLFNRLQDGVAAGSAGSGTMLFAGPVSASTIRKIACDADLIPLVLGSAGRVLDIGRASRVFPPHIRKAIVARDLGCAFPSCTIPGAWCEAHHVSYWSHGGSTSTENGTLLCSHHHHLVHKEQWTINMISGIPWFIPPPHVDPRQMPRRNYQFRLE